VSIADRIPVSPAILLREATRSSRQVRTYVSRAVFSGILMAIVLATVGVGTEAIGWLGAPDPATFGTMGRKLFLGFAGVEILIAMVLAPVMVSRAVIEEREERTIDLIVLTRLSPGQILLAKIASSLLVIGMIVLGGLPILGLVTSLGGVSVVEVVAVTLDAMAALVLLGMLGGFFALFTRSQALATGAALVWALPVFLVAPWLYAAGSAAVDGATHLSPLYGPAAVGWAALLPAIAYMPVMWRLMRIGTNVFAMRTASVTFGRLFDGAVWDTKGWLIEGGALLLTGLTVLPVGVVAAYTLMIAATSSGLPPNWASSVMMFAARGTVWLWSVLFLSWSSWIYLRLGSEWVIALESMFTSSANPRDRKARGRTVVAIAGNPVMWRELRPRAFAGYTVAIIVWIVIMWAMFQSFLWIIPGGLLTIGLANAAAGWFGAAWLAASTVERERREGTLELLLTTTLSSPRVVLGKLAGVAMPTLPLVLVACPLIAIGVPQATLVSLVQTNADFGEVVELGTRGLMVGVWAVAFWAFVTMFSFVVAIRVRKPRAAFGINLGVTAAILGIPWMLTVAFGTFQVVLIPLRVLVPIVTLRGPWWEPAFSIGALSVAAVVLLAMTSRSLRPWVAASMGALLSLFAVPRIAEAQQPPAPPAIVGFAPNEDGIAMRALPLADGLYRQDRWTAMRVQLLNVGDDAQGSIDLSETSADGSQSLAYHRDIELPKGARKEVVLPVRPGFAFGQRQLVFQTTDGREATVPYKLTMLNDGDVGIGVIGDEALGINTITDTWGGPVAGRSVRAPTSTRAVRAGLIPVKAMPDRSAAYGSLDWIVWPQADPGDVPAESLDALRDWVADGGHLVVTVTDNAPKVAGTALGEMLPVELLGTEDVADLGCCAMFDGKVVSAGGPVPIANARLRDVPGRDTWVWATLPDGRPLWVSGTYGLGTVHVVMADPSVAPLSNTDKPAFWRRLLWLPPAANTDVRWLDVTHAMPSADWGVDPTSSFLTTDWNTSGLTFTLLDTWDGSGFAPPMPVRFAEAMHFGTTGGASAYAPDMVGEYGPTTEWYNALRGKLADIPGVAPMPLSWLLLFSVAYLFVIGPFDWFVLRAIGRQPVTWITFPVYIVAFSALALVGTSLRKGNQAAVVRVELVDALPGTDLWRGETFLGVFATRKTDLELRAGFEDAVVTTLQGDSGAMWDPHVVADEGPGALAWRAETWTLAYARTAWTGPAKGAIKLEHGADGHFRVTNGLPFALVESGLQVEGMWYPIGPIAAGATRDLGPALTGSTFTPSTPGYGYDDGVDLRTADPAALLGWAQQAHLVRPNNDRGLMDAMWAHPALVGVAETPVEALTLSGLEPQSRQITIVRMPVDRAAVAGMGGAITAATAYNGYGYTPPPSGPVYLAGSVLKLKSIAPDDSSYYAQSTVVGVDCVATTSVQPTDAQWFNGSVTCDNTAYYFSKFKFDVVSQPEVFPVGTQVSITDVPWDDSNYASRDQLLGKTCNAIGALDPYDQNYYTGQLMCDGTTWYFTKVRFNVISKPKTYAIGQQVKVKDLGPDDSYVSSKSTYVGQICTVTDTLVPNTWDGTWWTGTLDCPDGNSYWFYEIQVDEVTTTGGTP
jgi:ABC-type transport system involved in multi-copper enzyme maturation permease subunit